MQTGTYAISNLPDDRRRVRPAVGDAPEGKARSHEWLYPDAPSPRQCRFCLKMENELATGRQEIGICDGLTADCTNYAKPRANPLKSREVWCPGAEPHGGRRLCGDGQLPAQLSRKPNPPSSE